MVEVRKLRSRSFYIAGYTFLNQPKLNVIESLETINNLVINLYQKTEYPWK